jgi:hypothetical protein
MRTRFSNCGTGSGVAVALVFIKNPRVTAYKLITSDYQLIEYFEFTLSILLSTINAFAAKPCLEPLDPT